MLTMVCRKFISFNTLIFFLFFLLEPCIEFLRKQAIELSLEFRIESPVTPKKPIVILTWIGTQPELKSIILNSHMDVVPVFEVVVIYLLFST